MLIPLHFQYTSEIEINLSERSHSSRILLLWRAISVRRSGRFTELVREFQLRGDEVIFEKSIPTLSLRLTWPAAARDCDCGFDAVLTANGHTCSDTPALKAQAIVAHHNATLAGPLCRVVQAEEWRCLRNPGYSFLGYSDAALSRLGRYTVGEVEFSGPADTLVIRGKTSDMHGSGKSTRNGSWKGVSMVSDVAARNGWSPV